MRVMIIGKGGREHALAWKISQSPRLTELFIAPGNGGTRLLGKNVPIPVTNHEGLLSFALQQNIDLTIVGPDDPLAAGIVDLFQAQGLLIFGPQRQSAIIESSKAFGKGLMLANQVPTANFKVFSVYSEALSYVATRKYPLVVKADGLALGKGVFVCRDMEQAVTAVASLMEEGSLGEAGRVIVIEDYLPGREFSVHTLTDGEYSLTFIPAGDYKRAKTGDMGPNTGGMGAVAPVPWVTDGMMFFVKEGVVKPTLDAMAAMGLTFTGCLYPGMISTEQGLFTLEYNGRFGDPETQVLMMLLKYDLLGLLKACAEGTLRNYYLDYEPGFAVCVVLASEGYPGEIKTGFPITGIAEAEQIPGVQIFHAGTEMHDSVLYTSGGRVLNVCARGATLAEAINRAYKAVRMISFKGMQYRADIGADLL